MLHAVIMAGGSGTRFWPWSRQHRPKHLLQLAGSESLLQQTYARIALLLPPERILVVTAADHVAACREQLPQLADRSIVAEPCRRDTAACIGLGAEIVCHRDAGGVMAVMPADHRIRAGDEFRRLVAAAAELVDAQPARLVTFGIRPTRPATGYGYIHRGAPLAAPPGLRSFRVQAFREKPGLELAEQFVESGEYYWNSGIFVWRARTILDELRASKPALVDALERIGRALGTPAQQDVLAAEFPALERISIDYAVMERASDVAVIEATFDWDDVGSWQAIDRLHPHTAGDNTVLGTHCGLDTHECIVVTEPGHLVATLGVDHLVIVQSGNVTFVADKRDEESVKKLVDQLRRQGMEVYL
jgi:mannose-1-phosphate guanylyltransferase